MGHTVRVDFLYKNMTYLLFKALYHIRGTGRNPERCKRTLDDDDEFHLFKAVNNWLASPSDKDSKFYTKHYCFSQCYNVSSSLGNFNDKATCHTGHKVKPCLPRFCRFWLKLSHRAEDLIFTKLLKRSTKQTVVTIENLMRLTSESGLALLTFFAHFFFLFYSIVPLVIRLTILLITIPLEGSNFFLAGFYFFFYFLITLYNFFVFLICGKNILQWEDISYLLLN